MSAVEEAARGPERREREAWVVIDLGFGDAGKGSCVDFLCRARGAHTVVRWHGGAQAGHNVVTADGRHHTFSQLGAGSFAGAETLLAGDFVLHPTALLAEAAALEAKGVADPLGRVRVDGAARVITPWHQASNRLRELARGAGAHGTCGVGFGETVRLSLEAPELTIRARDLWRPAALPRRLAEVRERVRDELAELLPALRSVEGAAEELALLEDGASGERWIEALAPLLSRELLGGGEALEAALARPGAVVFEGAQGVLLDEWRGFHPHTPWSPCTSHGVQPLLAGYGGEVTRLGVLRSYATRHGAGPFPTHDPAMAHAEPHNGAAGWQGAFRQGPLDLVLLRYALAVSPVDALALTHVDRVRGPWPIVRRYAESRALLEGGVRLAVSPELEDLAFQTRLRALLDEARPERETVEGAEALVATLEAELEAPVRLLSAGPTADAKRWRDAPLVESALRAPPSSP